MLFLTPSRVSSALVHLAPTGFLPACVMHSPILRTSTHSDARLLDRCMHTSPRTRLFVCITGRVYTVHSCFHGCTLLRAVWLSGFPRTRPHLCLVAAHHILHAHPQDASGCASVSYIQNSLVTFHYCLELRSSPSVWYFSEDPLHPYPLEQIFVVGWIGVSPLLLWPHAFGGLSVLLVINWSRDQTGHRLVSNQTGHWLVTDWSCDQAGHRLVMWHHHHPFIVLTETKSNQMMTEDWPRIVCSWYERAVSNPRSILCHSTSRL